MQLSLAGQIKAFWRFAFRVLRFAFRAFAFWLRLRFVRFAFFFRFEHPIAFLKLRFGCVLKHMNVCADQPSLSSGSCKQPNQGVIN